MKIELLNPAEKPAKTNRLDEFKVGDIGVIREWGDQNWGNRIVKRVTQDEVVSLSTLISGGAGYFCSDYTYHMNKLGNFYIETFQPGTEIKITL
jgi:hypothetical protein